MMHVLYSSKESTRNGEKGILISLRYDLLLSLPQSEHEHKEWLFAYVTALLLL